MITEPTEESSVESATVAIGGRLLTPGKMTMRLKEPTFQDNDSPTVLSGWPRKRRGRYKGLLGEAE